MACLDLSSFKCGHDAPTYGLIDSIIASAGKAYSALHDIDAKKPSGSIKIRVKTYAYTLMLLKEKLEDHGVLSPTPGAPGGAGSKRGHGSVERRAGKDRFASGAC
jgi:hypothetical protein